MADCNTCAANKVCDHDRFGFENCGNYVSDIVKESFIEGIIQAKKEALKQGMLANAVLINDRKYFSRINHEGREIPMICGLKAFYTDELPDDTLFAVVRVDASCEKKDERIAELEEENEMLKNRLNRITNVLERSECE